MENFVFINLINLLINFVLHIFRDEGVAGGSTSALACVDDIPHLK